MSESIGWGTGEVPCTAKPPECELAFQFYYSKPFYFNFISHKNLVRTLTLNSTLPSFFFSFVNDISDCCKSF